MKCRECGQPVGELEVFPGQRCLKCYAREMDKIPLSQLPPPDFVAPLIGRKRKQRRVTQ